LSWPTAVGTVSVAATVSRRMEASSALAVENQEGETRDRETEGTENMTAQSYFV
jgi:hypothetical protein